MKNRKPSLIPIRQLRPSPSEGEGLRFTQLVRQSISLHRRREKKMNANNRFMNYTIANIRVSLPDACTGEHFTRALRPFLTLGAGPADLALEIVPRIPA